MTNYSPVEIEYNADTILSELGAIAKGEDFVTLQCNIKERIAIRKITGINLPISSILYFRLDKLRSGLIHIDTDADNPIYDSLFALNLPLLNCKKVSMDWFIQKDMSTAPLTFAGPSHGSKTPRLPLDNAMCIDTCIYDTPQIVKIDSWHSVTNHSNIDIAYFISIRFPNTIKYNTVLEILKNKS